MKHTPDMYARRRLEVVAGTVALGFALLIVRAVDLQWLQADRLAAQAEKQRHRQFTVSAPRGAILDRKGRILAESIKVPSISAIAEDIPKTQIPRLARALGMRPATLRKRLVGRRGFVWLARQTSPETAERLLSLRIPGIRRETEWRRYYPLGPETGHILGFVGVDGKGLEGLERSLDDTLRGRPGSMQIRRDARGNLLPDGIWLRRARPGKPVRLYLDATIQSAAYAALAEGVRRHGARAGSVVVMRPDDGAILAMVSWPSFNANNFRNSRPSEWRNRAITDVFEPGSVLKPFAVAAALLSGHWKPTSRIFCENGRFAVANYVIHDDHPEGWLDIAGVLVHSSNIGAAKLALDVGAEPLYRVLTDVGFSRRTGIGLGGESPGILPPLSRWGPVETATIAFGQGIAVTPLQLATAFSVLASGGSYHYPALIQDGSNPTPGRQVLPHHIARTVMTMLERATGPDGTGRLAVPAGYRVAGKTGTAQKPGPNGGYAPGKFTAVFAGAVPARHPAVVIAVVVDEPHDSIYGGRVAAPIFRKIAAGILPYLGVSPHVEPQPHTPWHSLPVSVAAAPETTPAGATPSLLGMSLREVRRIAMRRDYQLRVHGSGWVRRQQPAAFAPLPAGATLEVWLDD